MIKNILFSLYLEFNNMATGFDLNNCFYGPALIICDVLLIAISIKC